MKKLIVVFVIMFAAVLKTDSNAWQTDVDLNFFYHNLNHYGEWIQVDYDLVVWKPYNVNRGWSPYSVGQWEYTSYGWYWDSYEPFGWATYHYGRWYYDDFYGWVWVPGYEWGPSWVEWRYSNSYIGWSPLPPYADFRVSVGIHFSHNYRTSYHYWNFVTFNRFCQRNVNVYFVKNVNKNYIFNNTKYRTNYYADRGRVINGGVDRNYVERRAGNRIALREVTRTNNLRDYTGSRGNANSNRIVSYIPSEKEVQKYTNSDVRISKRASSKSNLRKDIVTFRNEESKSRSVNNGRSTSVTENRPKINNSNRTEIKSRRIFSGNEEVKSSSRYQIQPNSNKENNSYRKPVSRREVSKSVRNSVSRSTSKSSSTVNRSKSNSNNRPTVTRSNRNSNINKSYRSNSNSRSTSKSSKKSSSSSRGKRK